MYIFFDTETTWLPKNWKAPVSDLDNWPRMVQLAWIIYDELWSLLKKQSFIIKPEGFEIPKESSDIHRITTEIALQKWIKLSDVLLEFQNDVNSASVMVAHNFSFDEKIVGAEFCRQNMENIISTKKSICTMQSSTNYCQIPGNYWHKRPNLTELHQKLFWASFEEAHDALVDVEACAKCFRELRSRGVIRF